ncbi:hypothetical protein Tco_1284487 [Tanacetum coccineum]
MLAKQNDPISKEKKVNTTPINYVELNRLFEDFGKTFVPQQELSAEQAFWLQTSHPNIDQSDISPVKIEAPRELPKVSLVNTSLKKLKYHIGQFDTVVKKRITPYAITEGELGFEHTKAVFLNEIIPLFKTLKDIFNVFYKDLLNEDKSCNNQNALELSVYFENNDLKAQLKAKDTTICKLKEHIKSMRENNKEEKVKQEMDEIETINIELEHSQIQEMVFVTTALQNELRRLKGKNVLYNTTTITNATTIALGMFKLDLDPLVPSEKLVVVLPMNKVKKVRFSEPLTSSSNIHKQVKSSKTPDSNTYVLPSTGLKSSTSASRSQPTGNKNNDRISQTPSSNMKNKVEVQLRRANSSSNKKNHVKDPICDENVKHTMLNANSELICVIFKQCMFDANHDVCFLDFVNDVNVHSKSKSAKQSQQHDIWKPTGKVFTEVGYKWKPTGKLFTLVGNSCPLTRFTSANLVPPKETTYHSVETQKLEIKVYCRRLKQVKSVGSSKKSKIIKSRIANNSKPNHSWGSNATCVPSSSSLISDMFSRLFSGFWTLNAQNI